MKSSSRRVLAGITTAGLMAGLGVAGITAPAQAGAAAPVRLVVGLKAGADASSALPALSGFGLGDAGTNGGGVLRDALAEVRAKTLDVPAAKATALVAALKLDPKVSYVEVDSTVRAFAVAPNDPIYRAGKQKELSQIKAPVAWATTAGGAVKVAVVDSGVTPVGDLSGKVLRGYDFVNRDATPTDEYGHGTTVASLIAAKTNNGAGMAGVCAQCEILPVRVLNWEGKGASSAVAAGIIYAAKQNAKIINLSLGGAVGSPVMKDAIAYANGRGALVVASAGNSGNGTRSYPAAYADVLSVGATDTRTGGTARAAFSSYGASWVDVAAPGYTAGMLTDGSYCWVGLSDCTGNDYIIRGTSFSAPLVSGVAALVASKNPKYSGWGLSNAITSSSRKIGGWVKYGLVDANAALTRGTDTAKPSATTTSPGGGAKVRGTVAVTPVGLKDTGGSGIRNVDLYVNGKWHSWDYVAPFAPKLNTKKYNGAIAVRLRLTDKAGNISWLGARSLVADNTPPKASITKAPKNKARVKGTVTVSVKASDKYGVSKVQLLVNGKVVATDKKAGYKLSFKVSKQKKTMKVVVRAYDRAGNVTKLATRTYYRR
ncbi:S8 family serine peptidase [Actinoplanes sp. NPDC023936]|uniref:S8 family serine peptidase n=1 Tax=Actinoplanes sp. NPDC023936 TaxID=3154910 RepID=UPI0033FAABB5